MGEDLVLAWTPIGGKPGLRIAIHVGSTTEIRLMRASNGCFSGSRGGISGKRDIIPLKFTRFHAGNPGTLFGCIREAKRESDRVSARTPIGGKPGLRIAIHVGVPPKYALCELRMAIFLDPGEVFQEKETLFRENLLIFTPVTQRRYLGAFGRLNGRAIGFQHGPL